MHDLTKSTKPDAKADTTEYEDDEDEWPPNRFRILCAMRARRMAGIMTSQDVEHMDEGPPETWPDDLWGLLGFSPPTPKMAMSSVYENPSSPHMEHPPTYPDRMND